MNEVRIKLPLKLHQQWSDAAELRGLSLTSFIISTISGVLLSTGEIVVGSVSPPTPAPKPAPKPVSIFDPEPEPEYKMTPEQQALYNDWTYDGDD